MRDLYTLLRQVHHELRHGSFESQDVAITDLHNALESAPAQLCPSFLYPILTEALTYYCREILPKLPLSEEDTRFFERAVAGTCDRLQTQESLAREWEAQFKDFLLLCKERSFNTATDVVQAFAAILLQRRATPAQSGKISKDLERRYRECLKSPFTSAHVAPFFETLISKALSAQAQQAFAATHALFRDQLADLLQPRAVLVNLVNRQALITRMDVTTALHPAGLDELTFGNSVDEAMYASCWSALQAARTYLDTHFPDFIPLLGGGLSRESLGVGFKQQSLHVTCRFPNPAAEYNDRSISLLVGLKIVGDALDLEIDPQTLVTGALDSSGQVLAVNHLPDKLQAVEQVSPIRALICPSEGGILSSSHIKLKPVHTFKDALLSYYGDTLRHKLRSVSRRKIIKGAVAVVTASVGAIISKRILTIPAFQITKSDYRVLEYAKSLVEEKSDYQGAHIILTNILERFQENNRTAKSIYFHAELFDLLGLVALRQNRTHESLLLFQRALKLWESIHEKSHQVNTLFYIGDVYRYAATFNENSSQGRLGLQYYAQAYELVHCGMEQEILFRGRYHGVTSYIYYWLGEHERAEHYSRECLQIGSGLEATWDYQFAKQHLGRVLIQCQQYDEAKQILQETAQSPFLQTPYQQVNNLWTLGDLLIATGKIQEGLNAVQQGQQLCEQYSLKSQSLVLARILRKHRLSLSMLGL